MYHSNLNNLLNRPKAQSSWGPRVALLFPFIAGRDFPSTCTLLDLPLSLLYSVAIMNPSHPTLTSNQPTVLPLTNSLYPPAHPDSQNRATTITSESNTVHRCELMEKGLNEIRTALGALKMTCATLEMHADRLGSEIAALKVVASTPPASPMDSQGGFSLHTPVSSTVESL